MIAALAFTSFFQVGFLRIALNAARSRPVRFRMLVSGGDRMWPMLWTTLFVQVATLVGLLLLVVPGGRPQSRSGSRSVLCRRRRARPSGCDQDELGGHPRAEARPARPIAHRRGTALFRALDVRIGIGATGPIFVLAQTIVFTRISRAERRISRSLSRRRQGGLSYSRSVVLFADTCAIPASSVLAYGSRLRATRRRPRLVSTKITALLPRVEPRLRGSERVGRESVCVSERERERVCVTAGTRGAPGSERIRGHEAHSTETPPASWDVELGED